ncbi:MAG TPA: lanthionine synthetase C family protein [Streptosporangiaceae bacterium]
MATALLHIYRAHCGTGSWTAAHQQVTTMTRAPVRIGPNRCGLHQGAVEIAYVLHTAGRTAYAPALDNLDRHISCAARTRLAAAHQRIDMGHLPELREFDLISGLTGIGVYLLHRQACGELLEDILAYLVRLTGPIHSQGETVPGWWTGNGLADQPSADRPGGHGNLGLAHGITGPLALLSAGMRRGITVPGQADAIAIICSWLDQWRIGTGARAWWPGLISRLEHRHGHVHQEGPQRPSWCYGTPGIARAQQLAGLATGNMGRQHAAELALAGCVTDKSQLAQLQDASVCHGWAGLTLTTRRAAADADPDSPLPNLVPHLADQLREAAASDHSLRAGSGLLLGADGVELTSQTLHGGWPPSCPWDTCLLLAG